MMLRGFSASFWLWLVWNADRIWLNGELLLDESAEESLLESAEK